MFENIAALAVASFLSVGTFASSLVSPGPQIVSPVPKPDAKLMSKQSQIPTNTPTSLPTSTPTPSPTKTPPTPQPKADRPLDETPSPTAIPTPTPTPAPFVTGQELDNFFTTYSSQYGIDREQLRKIAQCESSFNPNANNLGYGGMYQFSEGSWISTRGAMGQNTDPALRYNAEESIKTAAYKLSQPNGANAWPSCK